MRHRGKNPLKDSQRRTLLTNLLQSNSQARPGCTIGQAHFVIGGDMNTDSHRMSNMLQECRHHGSLRTQAQIHEPASPKHGDLCIVAGIRACTLTTSAPNHDPQHNPYGICWTAADLPLLQKAEQAAQIPDDAAAATEHSEETTNLRTPKDLAQRWQGVLDETLCRAGD